MDETHNQNLVVPLHQSIRGDKLSWYIHKTLEIWNQKQEMGTWYRFWKR